MLHSFRSVGIVALDDVIRTFLCQSRTVDFVCVAEIVESTAYGSSAPRRFSTRVWSTLHKAMVGDIERVLDQGLRAVPIPVQSAINTLNLFDWAGDRQRLWGRYKGKITMTDNSVEMSLRGVMDYLAGRIDRAEFETIVPSDWLANLRRN
jgi:hypothetical protein